MESATQEQDNLSWQPFHTEVNSASSLATASISPLDSPNNQNQPIFNIYFLICPHIIIASIKRRAESSTISFSLQGSLVNSKRHLASRHSLKLSDAEVHTIWGDLISQNSITWSWSSDTNDSSDLKTSGSRFSAGYRERGKLTLVLWLSNERGPIKVWSTQLHKW